MTNKTQKRLRKAGFSKLSAKFIDRKANGKKKKKRKKELLISSGYR